MAVIGLGYVCINLAVLFAQHFRVIGYDCDCAKIEKYLLGIDVTGEIGSQGILESGITFTSDERLLDQANFFVVAIPTTDYLPDLHFVIGAMGTVGRYLHKEDVVVLESTVYPGVTEDACVPVLEKASSMVCGKDFFVGYSPERISPGDVFHRIDNSAKLVSGMDGKPMSVFVIFLWNRCYICWAKPICMLPESVCSALHSRKTVRIFAIQKFLR